MTAGEATHRRTAAPVAHGFDAPIDRAALRRIVEAISSVGSPVGHRATGTPEEHEVAEIVAAEMRAIGLANVAFEDVPVDGWWFRQASVSVADGPAFRPRRSPASTRRRPAASRASWSSSATAAATGLTGST